MQNDEVKRKPPVSSLNFCWYEMQTKLLDVVVIMMSATFFFFGKCQNQDLDLQSVFSGFKKAESR